MPITPPRAEHASSDANDSYLEGVKAEIRAEADAARLRAPLPRNEAPPPRRAAAISHDGSIDRSRLDYTIAELSGEHYTAFIDGAFRALLKRPPDEPGLDAQVRLLAAGAPKAEVLGNLRYSPEGRAIGARVGGLLPRYALAKLGRVPVVGFVLNWFIAFAGLPLMLRHQRAADTRNAAQFQDTQWNAGRIADDVRGTNARIDGVRSELGETTARLGELKGAFDQRVGTLEARVGENESRLSDVPALRHYVHAVNHWLVSLQAAIDGIEGASDANKAYADSLIAAIYDAGEVATARGARQSAWIDAMRRHLGARARVVDLGSGDGSWAALLAGLGADVAGFESNGVLARRARERGLNVAAGDPMTALARCADASLDAVTVSGAPAGDAFATLLAESARALKPGGWLLIAAGEPRRLADLGNGRIGVLDRAIAAAMLGAAGFALDAGFGGPDAVLARRA